MRKTRFEPKERTKSYIFLPPMLEIDPVFMQTHLLLNCYLYSEDLPDIRNSIFLHYEFQDLNSSFARLENNFKKSPYYRGMYEPDKYTVIFYFHVPNKWYKDYLLFINSKYSHISEGLKTQILRYYNIGQSSQVYKVLYRDSEKRKELEKELDVTLPEDAEIASAIDFSKETYTEMHKIKEAANPNYEIYQI